VDVVDCMVSNAEDLWKKCTSDMETSSTKKPTKKPTKSHASWDPTEELIEEETGSTKKPTAKPTKKKEEMEIVSMREDLDDIALELTKVTPKPTKHHLFEAFHLPIKWRGPFQAKNEMEDIDEMEDVIDPEFAMDQSISSSVSFVPINSVNFMEVTNMDDCVQFARSICAQELQQLQQYKTGMNNLAACINRNMKEIESKCTSTVVDVYPVDHPPCRHHMGEVGTYPLCPPEHSCGGHPHHPIMGFFMMVFLFIVFAHLGRAVGARLRRLHHCQHECGGSGHACASSQKKKCCVKEGITLVALPVVKEEAENSQPLLPAEDKV